MPLWIIFVNSVRLVFPVLVKRLINFAARNAQACEGCGAMVNGRDSKRFCSKKCVWVLNSRVASEKVKANDGKKAVRRLRLYERVL